MLHFDDSQVQWKAVVTSFAATRSKQSTYQYFMKKIFEASLWVRVLQVRENWKKLGNLCGQGKSRERSGENVIFEKLGKMILDHADCRYLWFCFASKYKKTGKFAAFVEHLRARSVSASGALPPWPSERGLCPFAYCFINTASFVMIFLVLFLTFVR